MEQTEYTHLGKLHASVPTPIGGFLPVVGGEVGVTYLGGDREEIDPKFLQGVYQTPELVSSGGMSGGGLFVDDEGIYRLAAIYLGESGASGVFRAIDGEVIDLINRVANLADNSSGSDGYDSADTERTTSEYLFEELTIGLGGLDDPENQPGSARIVGNFDDILVSGDTYELIGVDGEDAIVFNPVPGYLTPPIQHITIDDFETPYSAEFHIYAEYIPDFQALTASIAEIAPPSIEDLSADADYDRDGASNLLEWASGLDMNNSSDAHLLTPGTGTSGLPHISLVTNEHGVRKLRIEYIGLAPELAPHVNYICEFSNDLVTWIPVTSELRSPLNSNWHRVIVDDAVSINDRSKRYARVRVTYTPLGE